MAAIAQWIHLPVHHAAMGSNPMHVIYAFSISKAEIETIFVIEKNENKQRKRDQYWPIFKKLSCQENVFLFEF